VTTAALSGTPSNWLYVANAGNDAITTFRLDSTGIPSAPADTQLMANPPLPGGGIFHVVSITTDPSGQFLICAGNQTRAVLVGGNLPAVLPIQLASGTLTPGTAVTGKAGVSIGVVATANVVIAVTSASQGTLDSYTYATPGGAVTAGTSMQQGTSGPPAAAVIDPTATYVYCVNPIDQTAQAFPIDTGGFITGGVMLPAAIPTPARAQALVIDPFGYNIFLGNSDGTISSFQIASPGQLAAGVTSIPVEPTGAAANASIQSIAIDPTGTYLVTANGPSGDVSLLQIAATGITLVGKPYATPNAAIDLPASVAFNQGGNVVYVANAGTSTISALALTSAGLAPLPGSPFALPAGDTVPASLAVSQ
jgi:hypothetical protein